MKIEEKDGGLLIVDFNELDAYKIACKIEEDGIRFYKNIINSIKNKEAKERLKYLLNEERKHLKFFEGLLSEIGQKVEDNFEEDNLFKYLDYGIFKPFQDMKGSGELIEDVEKALELGILIEDKSIKFYKSCADNVSFTTKKELGNIIEEEKRHRALFEDLLKKIKN